MQVVRARVVRVRVVRVRVVRVIAVCCHAHITHPSSADVFSLADEDVVFGPQYGVGDEGGGSKPSSRRLKLDGQQAGQQQSTG